MAGTQRTVRARLIYDFPTTLYSELRERQLLFVSLTSTCPVHAAEYRFKKGYKRSISLLRMLSTIQEIVPLEMRKESGPTSTRSYALLAELFLLFVHQHVVIPLVHVAAMCL